jgi:hypothetical protein
VYDEIVSKELDINNRSSYEDEVEQEIENELSSMDVEEAEMYVGNEGIMKTLELYDQKEGLENLKDKDKVRRILELLKVLVLDVIYEGFEEEYQEYLENNYE